jgi:hypothetical protein
LLGVASAVLALADMLDLLVNERACGGRRSFAFSLRFARALDGFGFGHLETLLCARA